MAAYKAPLAATDAQIGTVFTGKTQLCDKELRTGLCGYTFRQEHCLEQKIIHSAKTLLRWYY